MLLKQTKRSFSQLEASSSDLNLKHHFTFPLSMTALGKVFENPILLKFFLESLSDIAPLTNITVLEKAFRHREEFVFEALNQEKPVCITLAASEMVRFFLTSESAGQVDHEYEYKMKEIQSDDSKSKYASYTAIYLFGETWEKPFRMGEALSMPYEQTKSLGETSTRGENSNTFKSYVLPTFLQPGYPYLDAPPFPLTD